VVQWFEDRKVNPGVVRFFWPSMGQFLPSDHPFHTAKPNDRMDVTGIGSIIPLLRETSATVLSGMLAPPRKPDARTIRFGRKSGELFDIL
jgi:hypothetical protein